MSLLVIVAALCAIAPAQGVVQEIDPPTPLSSWRCVDADEQRFADPAFDDSSWKTLTVPETGDRVCGANVSWLRTRVDVATAVRTASLGVSVGIVEGGYQLFVDGVRVGGDESLDGEALHVGRGFAIPAELDDDGTLIVALRVVNNPALFQVDPKRVLLPVGPFAVGGMPGVGDRARMLVSEAVQQRSAGYIASLLLVLFVALYHCLVWLLRRELRGYLWFAVTTTLIVGWMGLTNLHSTEMLPLSAVNANVVGNFVGSLVNAAFISFLWRFIPRSPPSRAWRMLQFTLVAIAFVGFVPGSGLAWTVSAPVVIVKIATPLLAMIQLIVWMLRGERDARLLLFGTFVGAVVAPLELYFEQHGIHLSVTPAQAGFIAWILVMAVGLASQFSRTLSDVDQRNRELRETNASIARFVPFGFLDALGKKSVGEVNRGEAQQHEMAVMFCDVRGFTTLAESLGPQETFTFINEYLARMEPEIYRASGFINQYLGDGIMALFPSSAQPLRSGADGAVAAAIGMANALAKLNGERARLGQSEIKIGAGIHMGPLMIGTIGGGEQLDGGVVGDCVNASARLEGMTKMYGAKVLVSGSVISRLERTRPMLRHLDTVRAKGKTEATLISEILDVDPHAELKKQTLSDFVDAQRAYQAGVFAEAKRLFQRCLEVCPDDGAARLLLERCDELAAAPPPDWIGVYTLTSK